MKLQYLGDSRDAFKWDLLHWVCSRSEPHFSQLLFIPMLTPDDPVPRHGNTPHRLFPCRPEIRSLIELLRTEPRSLTRIGSLGGLDPTHRFEVQIYAEQRSVGRAAARWDYWRELRRQSHSNTVVFLDPDNGFETETQHGPKWVRHAEVAYLLEGLPDSSVVVVYQHRPRRTWSDVFAALRSSLDYAPCAAAVCEANLAFVILAANGSVANRVTDSVQAYCLNHRNVQIALLRGGRGD